MPRGTFDEVINKLGLNIDPDLLDLALTHRSWAYENGNTPTNERLEFLGDAVLGVVVTEHLYRVFPDHAEGQLAKMRARVVSAIGLAEVARKLAIGDLIKLGRGEITTGGNNKTSILADTTEAIIGAIYLSEGKLAVERFVHHLFDPMIATASELGAGLDWKTSLQESASVLGLTPVSYQVEESGPDHCKEFRAWAVLAGEKFGPGEGKNKKQAEQQAAQIAFQALEPRLRQALDNSTDA